MKDKRHFWCSIIKSILRMGACVYAMTTGSVLHLALGFLVAEGVGILEEIFDRR